MFEFNQLRCFVAVAEELNFRRAAATLNMTQPPVSRQVQLLEHRLGVRLLERTSRSVRLTAAGRFFLPEAQFLLRRAESIALAAQRASRGEDGSVSIGFIPAASYSFLPRVVTLIRNKLPNVELILREMNTGEQIEALRSRRIDLGLTRLPLNRRGINARCIVREPFIAAVPQGHALASRRKLSVRSLDQQPFIMYSPAENPLFYELLSGVFRSAAVAPDYVQYVSHTHTVLSLVSTGMGIALVPEAARNLRFENVTFRPVDLGASAAAETYLVWQTDNENPIFSTIFDLMHAQPPTSASRAPAKRGG